MILKDLLKVMPKEQEIVVFTGFNIQFIGKNLDCHDKRLAEETVKGIESNGKNLTIKLI